MSETRPVPLFQIIGSLQPAGAERLVLNLLLYHDRAKYQPICICLGSEKGTHYEQIARKHEIPLYFLGKGTKADYGVYRKLSRLFCEYKPQIVHTHLAGLNYAYPLMIKHRTPVRVHTVHNIA